ncbi:hypothetical protein MHYP_G00349570 [Metynnis hypsauchen]
MSLGGIDTIAQTNGHEVSAASLLRHRGPLLRGGPLQPYKGGRGFRLPVYDHGSGLAWATTACALLRRVENLGYERHLFVLRLREMDLSGTSAF